MKNIYKYKITFIDSIIDLPTNAVVVKAGAQDGWVCLWVEHDLNNGTHFTRRYQVFATGADIPDSAIWQDTFFDGPFVWHVYEVVE